MQFSYLLRQLSKIEDVKKVQSSVLLSKEKNTKLRENLNWLAFSTQSL